MKALLIKYGARPATAHVADSGDIESLRKVLEGRIPGYSLNYENPSLADLAADSLWMGALNGNAEQVRLCLQYVKCKRDDARWNYVLVHAKTPEVVRIILEHDVDPDVVAARGYTILHHIASDYVAQENRVPFGTLLLDVGASLTKRDAILKSTPLGWACRWGRTELVSLYLKRGADPLEQEAEPWATPLAWATKGKHTAIIKLLRSHSTS
jgi:ankyrin repeat protein